MARIKVRSVDESDEELALLEESFRGMPSEPRIRLLRTVRLYPDLTFEQAAAAARVHPRSAYRWWITYRRLGIDGLIGLNRGRPPKSGSIAANQPLYADSASGHDLLSLINAMPTQLVLLDGINALRDRLLMLMPDVDRISIQVNTYCDLERPQDYRPNLSISQRADHSERLDEGLEVRALPRGESPSEELLEQMSRGGYPFERYREPISIDLWLGGTADLGAIILWREVEKEPVSDSTIAFVESIKPFLIYVFCNLVTRHHYANPGDRVFYSVLGEMSMSAKLTAHEQRVITYRLMGYSYKRIADELDRTVGVVKKHLASVHRKTGTQGHGEFFAKYFSPRLLPSE